MIAAFIFCLGAVLGYWILSSRTSAPLPPGPKGLPLVGNLPEIRQNGWVHKSLDWHRRYGPLVTLKLGDRTMILVGRQQVAKELLDKRGRIYSSRPRLVMAQEIMSRGDHTFFLPYGPKWKNHNRIQMSFLNARCVQRYQPLQELESLAALRHLLVSNDFEPIFLRFQASLVNTLAYGRRIPELDDPSLKELQGVSRAFIDAVTTNNWLVDSFPILKLLPSALAPWKRFGNRIHSETLRVNGGRITEGGQTKSWNWVKHVRGLKDVDAIDPHELVFIIGTIYQAGADIITGNLILFIMAAVLHPEAVQAVQSELDKVVGHDRLPDFRDMDYLPCLTAFIKEVQRWRPLAALGAPHALMEDDVYQGYALPRGTMILANQFAMEMDPALWDDPEEFRPERWMKQPSRVLSTFGFGRRKCVGQTMASQSLFIVVSRILWAFAIEHAFENGDRVEIDPWGFTQNSNTLDPKPFRARVHPRDDHRRQVLEESWASMDKDIDRLLEQVGQGI